MIVWISSMKRILFGSWMMNSSIDLRRSSNMPLSSQPARAPVMSASKITMFLMLGGTLPLAMRDASPSMMAVLPVPPSPTRMTLFLRRLRSTPSMRSSSFSRPMRRSNSPFFAASLRFLRYSCSP